MDETAGLSKLSSRSSSTQSAAAHDFGARRDFNVFLVGDATLATFPANPTPRFATNAAVSFASLENLITQISWIRHQPVRAGGA